MVKSIDVNEEHPENIPVKSVNLYVLKLLVKETELNF